MNSTVGRSLHLPTNSRYLNHSFVTPNALNLYFSSFVFVILNTMSALFQKKKKKLEQVRGTESRAKMCTKDAPADVLSILHSKWHLCGQMES